MNIDSVLTGLRRLACKMHSLHSILSWLQRANETRPAKASRSFGAKLLISVLIAVAAALTVRWILGHIEARSTYRGGIVSILNDQGQTTRELTFDTPVSGAFLEPIRFAQNDVVVSFADGGPKAGIVQRLGRHPWSVNTYDRDRMSQTTGRHSDHFSVDSLLKVDALDTRRHLYIAVAHDPRGPTTHIVAISEHGTILGEYWHSGILGATLVFPKPTTREVYVALGGVSNWVPRFFEGDTAQWMPVCVSVNLIGESHAYPPFLPGVGPQGVRSYSLLWFVTHPLPILSVQDRAGAGVAEMKIDVPGGASYWMTRDGAVTWVDPAGVIPPSGEGASIPWPVGLTQYEDSLVVEPSPRATSMPDALFDRRVLPELRPAQDCVFIHVIPASD